MIRNYKFTDTEIDELVRSMVILHDTREKSNDHIIDFYEKKKIPHMRKALHYGDYSFYVPKNEGLGIFRDIYFDKDIVIERKASLEELSNNFTRERDRLEKEFALAPTNKVVLIENSTYSDLVTGNYNSKYNKKSYWATLHSFWHKYKIPFFFMPNNEHSALFIRGYFEYYLKTILR